MERKALQEEFVRLFLRLNGYFVSGLVVHSPDFGKNSSEVDLLGVRLPHHRQEDRVVGNCEYLKSPIKGIDIIIGEVKSGSEKLQFNKSLRTNIEVMKKVVNWIGAFRENDIEKVSLECLALMEPKEANSPDEFNSLTTQSELGLITLRPIIFAIDEDIPRRNQIRYIPGQIMLDYMWTCLRPIARRESCSTNYDLEAWGHAVLPIIDYIKDERRTKPGKIEDLYKELTEQYTN